MVLTTKLKTNCRKHGRKYSENT